MVEYTKAELDEAMRFQLLEGVVGESDTLLPCEPGVFYNMPDGDLYVAAARYEAQRQRVAALEAQRDRLLLAGLRMSNFCFNLKQPGFTFEDPMRDGCGRMQIAWDEAVKAGREPGG